MSDVPANQYVITREGVLFEAGFAASFFGTTLEEELTIEALYITESHPGKIDSQETLAWLTSYLPTDKIERESIEEYTKDRSNKLVVDESYHRSFLAAYEAYEIEHKDDQKNINMYKG